MSRRKHKPNECLPADLSVYDGTRLLGFIKERPTGRTATTLHGEGLGTFSTRKAACDAISAALGHPKGKPCPQT
jgi:hypothetical protein